MCIYINYHSEGYDTCTTHSNSAISNPVTCQLQIQMSATYIMSTGVALRVDGIQVTLRQLYDEFTYIFRNVTYNLLGDA